MNRDDVINLLTIISTVDNRQVTDADIIVWHERLERFTEEECLEAVAAHQRESTEYLQPAHVAQRVRVMRNEIIERADPDDRPHLVGLTGVPRDRYGHIDKSAPDEDDYPHDWTPAQRVKAYWEKIENVRDVMAFEGDPDDPLTPHMRASDETRAMCMDHIRTVLNK